MSLLDMQGLEATRGHDKAERMGAESAASLLLCDDPSCVSTILCL
jgi:hypothetical protein